nr:hypothetical protein [Tanacetum cinerariifolium]
MGFYKQNSLQSKFHHASRISESVFVSNFLEGCTSKDLWKVCNDYGTVVDVFIPNKKSKAGKHFAFVRFIKVINLDRLIENLNTIWIGRFHLFANPVRFERPKKLVFPTYKDMLVAPIVPGPYISFASALVLDDSCVVECDLLKYAMGKVKDVNSIPNLRTLLMDEGFFDVKLKYLGAHSPFCEEVSGDDRESDIEEVSETIFGDNSSSPNNNSDEMGKQHFEDPFKIYDILKKQTGGETREMSSSLSHPPASCKRVLWEYVSNLICRWNRETIILDDFNEVRSIDERRGSCFNPSSARVFDHFISSLEGFDAMMEQTWRSFSHSDVNRMIRFKKKLQDLKAIIRCWVKDKRMHRRLELQRKLHDINQMEAKDSFQKSKIKWAIKGDENSKFFLGLINKKRSQLAIHEVFDNGADVERNVSRDEIRLAVWNCGENKSPGPDGYTFEFFRKYWNIVSPDFCEAVEYFFEIGLFSKGCNSFFVAL